MLCGDWLLLRANMLFRQFLPVFLVQLIKIASTIVPSGRLIIGISHAVFDYGSYGSVFDCVHSIW
jgi:hypothetical protein